MLIVEITNDESCLPQERLGIAKRGNYDYRVRVGRDVVATGRVENQEQRHFSLLLREIAEDARQQEVARILKD